MRRVDEPGGDAARGCGWNRFERVYGFWCRKRIAQAAAARLLGVTARTFRRWVVRYEAGGLSALRDQRVGFSGRRVPAEEVEAVEALYESPTS